MHEHSVVLCFFCSWPVALNKAQNSFKEGDLETDIKLYSLDIKYVA